MNAKDRLWELYQFPGSASDFGDALDAFAHELAEEIRASGGGYLGDPFSDGMDHAADLIDPLKRDK